MFHTGVRETSTFSKLAWIVSASLLLVLLVWISRHFFFYRARAVWIENGEVHWTLGSRAITDIEGVEIDTRSLRGPLFYTAILLKNRNGGEDDVIATCLSEPAETVAQRLRDMLNLPA